MKKWSFALLIATALVAFAVAGCGEEKAAETMKKVSPEPNTLISVKTSKAPALDAKNLAPVWNDVPALKVELANGDNFVGGKTEVTLKSVYSGEEAYFMVQWNDPTQTLERTPWVKQDDGAWKKTPAKEKYEDKLAFIWNINDSIKDFNTQGCAIVCHAGEAVPEGGVFGKKYTANPGEVGDIWHWKVARTDSLDLSPAIGSYVDDQALDSGRYDPEKREGEAGRYSDPGTKSYFDNRTDDKKMPKYQWQNKPSDPKAMNYLLDDNKVDLVDADWKAGDQLPALYIKDPTGDRSDIMANSYYSNGKWTLVFKRKLVTGSTASPPVDIQFSDLNKLYYFGVAAFDNAQLKHAYETGGLMFKFSQ